MAHYKMKVSRKSGETHTYKIVETDENEIAKLCQSLCDDKSVALRTVEPCGRVFVNVGNTDIVNFIEVAE